MIRTPKELEHELEVALHRECATVLDVRVDPEPYRDSFGPTTGVSQPGPK